MATLLQTITGSWSGSGSRYLRLRCEVWLVSQDTTALTSTIYLKYIAQRTTTAQTTSKQNAPWTQTVNGTTTSGNKTFDIRSTSANADYDYRTSDEIVIQHDSDGTKTISVSGTINLSGTSAGTGSFSGSVTLTAIPTTPPTVSMSLSDTGQSVVSVWVQNKSTVHFAVTASGNDGATIASYSYYQGSTLLATTTSNTYEVTPTTSGSITYKVRVTDSRGNYTDVSQTINVVAYSLPKITSTSTYRCDSSGNRDDVGGTYAHLQMSWEIASITGLTSTGTAKTQNSTRTLTNGIVYTPYPTAQLAKGYSVTYVVTDGFGETASKTDYIYSSAVNFQLYPSKAGGAAFGEMAQEDKFIVNHDAIFRGNMTFSDLATAMEGMFYRGAPSGDFDDLQDFGVYYLANSGMSNAPSYSYQYGHLIVIPFGSVVTQIVVKGDSARPIQTRVYIGNPRAWSAWKSVTGA